MWLQFNHHVQQTNSKFNGILGLNNQYKHSPSQNWVQNNVVCHAAIAGWQFDTHFQNFVPLEHSGVISITRDNLQVVVRAAAMVGGWEPQVK